MLKSITAVAVLACVANAFPTGEKVAQKVPEGKWFSNVIVFMFENHAEDEVIIDPNFAKYTKMGRGFENYFATTHPSQPNYLSLVAGDYFGANNDDNVDLNKTNIVDLLEKQGLDWKGYMEDFPGNCAADKSVGKYYRKHNPFISFDNIRNDAARCAKIVGLPELDADLKAGTLPAYSMLSPNIDNDAHNTNVSYGGKWLDSFLGPRLMSFPKGTLIVITWDEDDYSESNKVLTFLLDPHGSIFEPGTIDDTKYNHYSMLKTIELNWGLGDLGRNDVDAVPFDFSK